MGAPAWAAGGGSPHSPGIGGGGLRVQSGVKPVCVVAAGLLLLAVACRGGVPDSSGEAAPAESGDVTVGVPPDVDLSRHDVPLDRIYFDTFDGRAVRLLESTPELRAKLLDAIPPIDNPRYADASAGDWLDPADLVLGYLADGVAYAYPFKILNFHEIVNDELGGTPVLISYCPLCRSGIVYDRRLNGQTLSFGNTSALYESDLVMVDRTTGSYWWQVAGRAIVGPLTGAALTPLPSTVSTWSDWVTLHPDTLILTRVTGVDRPYEQDSFADYEAYLESGRFPFPVSAASLCSGGRRLRSGCHPRLSGGRPGRADQRPAGRASDRGAPGGGGWRRIRGGGRRPAARVRPRRR